MDGTGGSQEEEVTSHHDHDNRGSDARDPARVQHGADPGLDADVGAGGRGEVDRVHPRGMDSSGDAPSLSGVTVGDLPPDQFAEYIQQIEVHQGPLPSPRALGEYAAIDPEVMRAIVRMAEREQDAQIEARLTPVRAEAWALKCATVGVSFMPWLAIVAAVVFAVAGFDAAAIVTGVLGAFGGGAQIIQATRRPRAVQRPAAPTQAAPSRDKTGPTPKQPKKKRQK